MEGLDKIRAKVIEKEDTRNILNKLRLNVNQHCDRISNEVSNVSNYLMQQQEGVNKNTIAVNKELTAFRKAVEEGIKMEGRDKKIKDTFEERVEFLESCKIEIEQIKLDMARYKDKQAVKKAENEDKFMLLRAESKALKHISGVYWDYENCDENRLVGYVVSKINNRIKTFVIKCREKSSADIAEEVWALVEEVQCS